MKTASFVTRCFQHYTSQDRADHAASFRLGFRQRTAVGEFFYVHALIPDRCYPTRKRALQAGAELIESQAREAERAAS